MDLPGFNLSYEKRVECLTTKFVLFDPDVHGSKCSPIKFAKYAFPGNCKNRRYEFLRSQKFHNCSLSKKCKVPFVYSGQRALLSEMQCNENEVIKCSYPFFMFLFLIY